MICDLDLEGNKITVTMTLTTPGCPIHNSITGWVKEVLTRIDENVETLVNLIWYPPWSPEDMSDEAKRQLGRLN
ncbi:MAG: iron-sulfur cluster assembly protein [Ignavibacteriaceae bacterium]